MTSPVQNEPRPQSLLPFHIASQMNSICFLQCHLPCFPACAIVPRHRSTHFSSFIIIIAFRHLESCKIALTQRPPVSEMSADLFPAVHWTPFLSEVCLPWALPPLLNFMPSLSLPHTVSSSVKTLLFLLLYKPVQGLALFDALALLNCFLLEFFKLLPCLHCCYWRVSK